MFASTGQPEEKTFEVKEGANYRMTVEYYVRHKIVSGMRFHMEMKYKGIKNGVYTLTNPFLCVDTGPRLNIKTVLSTYGDFHVKDKTAVRTSYL